MLQKNGNGLSWRKDDKLPVSGSYTNTSANTLSVGVGDATEERQRPVVEERRQAACFAMLYIISSSNARLVQDITTTLSQEQK